MSAPDPSAPPLSPSLLHTPRAFTDQQILTSLLRQEWRLCRGQVIPLAMLWVIGLWVLVIFQFSGWLLAIGLIHVVVVSPAQAGRDVLDGTEEFSFSQPPGRSPLYLVRLAIGLAFLLANGLLGSLAIAGNLPQRLWSLCFSGGLTEPFATGSSLMEYGLVVLAPTAAHGITFAIAANAGTRAGVNLSWLGGIAATAGIAIAGLFLEGLLWRVPNGFLIGPALLATTVLAPLVGHQLYQRKEATGSGGSIVRGGGWGWWMVGIIAALVALMLLSFFFFRVSAVRSTPQLEPRQQSAPTLERTSP